MSRIITLSVGILMAIFCTDVVLSETAQQSGVETGVPIPQANRMAFGAKQSFGKAALQGSNQKPPDLNAAVDAANQAEQHVIDGSNVHFAASPNGVTATVIGKDGKPQRQIPLTVDQFGQYMNIGKDGQFDKLMRNGVVDTLSRLSRGQIISGTSKSLGDMAPLPSKDEQEGRKWNAGTKSQSVLDAEESGDAREIRREYQRPEYVGKKSAAQELEDASYDMFPGAEVDGNINAKRVAWMVQQKQQAIVNEINRSKSLIFPVGGR
jgi:hypothetical protein